MNELKALDFERKKYISDVIEAVDAFKKRRDEVRAEMSKGLKSLFGFSSLCGEILERNIILHDEDGNEFTLTGNTNNINIAKIGGRRSDGDLIYRITGTKPEYRAYIEGTVRTELRDGIDTYENAVKITRVLNTAVDALNEGYELYRTVMLRSEEVLFNLVERINMYRASTKKDADALNNIMDKLNRGNNGGIAEDKNSIVTIKVEKHRDAKNLRLVIEIVGLDNNDGKKTYEHTLV